MSRPQSRVRQHLVFPTSSFTALDPCAGEGNALAVITEGTQSQRCGVELDAYRAEEAKQQLDQVIYGNCFDVDCKVESCSCMILNPPYDTATSDDGAGQPPSLAFYCLNRSGLGSGPDWPS